MNILGMFARRPEAGHTKTRLAATIGNQAAATLYAAFLEDLLRRLGKRHEQFVVAVTPDDEETRSWFSSRQLSNTRLEFQPDRDLGDRIDWYFETAFAAGAKRVVLVGSDSPDLPDDIVDQAFNRLSQADAVLSPAADGGYVLVGMSRPIQGIFDAVSWSSATTLMDTVTAMQSKQMTVELLSPWYDIDTIDNLGTLLAMQRAPESMAASCTATKDCLESLWPQIQAAVNRAK